MFNVITLPVLNRCAQCGKPHNEGSPYCSFACHAAAEGWDLDEVLALPDEDLDDPDEFIYLSAEPSVCLCTCCGQNAVDAHNGYDTCANCIARH